jgi:hypothetical protein
MIELTHMLRQRLISINAELVDIARRHEKLTALKGTIEAAILQEDALAASRDADMSGVMPRDNPDAAFDDEEAAAPSPNLSRLLLSALTDGPRSLEQLKDALDPQIPGGANGRAINFALVGLQKGGHVHRDQTLKTWRLVRADEVRPGHLR